MVSLQATAKGTKGKEVAPSLAAENIPTYQSANQPQPARAEDDNSQFKALEKFMNGMRDNYTIFIPMLEIIVGHNHKIYIDKHEIT